MKIGGILCVVIIVLSLGANDCFAKGGFSSGGGRGGFSSGGRSFGSSRSFGGSSSRSYGAPQSTTTRTTITRNYYGGGSGYYHPYMMYPGFGMGYGYSNGLIEGLIIGNMMHPAGTTVYSGGGYSGNALLYPDGRVVNEQGYQVGNYSNGQFAPIQNGAMIAQPAPQPQEDSDIGWEVAGGIVIGVLVLLCLAALVG